MQYWLDLAKAKWNSEETLNSIGEFSSEQKLFILNRFKLGKYNNTYRCGTVLSIRDNSHYDTMVKMSNLFMPKPPLKKLVEEFVGHFKLNVDTDLLNKAIRKALKPIVDDFNKRFNKELAELKDNGVLNTIQKKYLDKFGLILRHETLLGQLDPRIRYNFFSGIFIHLKLSTRDVTITQLDQKLGFNCKFRFHHNGSSLNIALDKTYEINNLMDLLKVWDHISDQDWIDFILQTQPKNFDKDRGIINCSNLPYLQSPRYQGNFLTAPINMERKSMLVEAIIRSDTFTPQTLMYLALPDLNLAVRQQLADLMLRYGYQNYIYYLDLNNDLGIDFENKQEIYNSEQKYLLDSVEKYLNSKPKERNANGEWVDIPPADMYKTLINVFQHSPRKLDEIIRILPDIKGQ